MEIEPINSGTKLLEEKNKNEEPDIDISDNSNQNSKNDNEIAKSVETMLSGIVEEKKKNCCRIQ